MAKVVKAAAVQAEPEWLNLEASVTKTCEYISKAASNGANIIAFPELFVPGYPGWIWCVLPGRANHDEVVLLTLYSGSAAWTSR